MFTSRSRANSGPSVIKPGQFAREGGRCIEVTNEGIVHSRIVGDTSPVAFSSLPGFATIALLPPLRRPLEEGSVFRILSDEITAPSETAAVAGMSEVMRRLLRSGVSAEALVYQCPDGVSHYHALAVEIPGLNGDLRMQVLDSAALEQVSRRGFENLGVFVIFR